MLSALPNENRPLPLVLRPWHQDRGAHWTAYGSWALWDLPEHYGNPLKEYQAVREGVGIADLSFQRSLQVHGEERVPFLQKILSNDLAASSPTCGLHSLLLTAKGKMLADIHLYALEASIFIEMEGIDPQALHQTLMRYRLRSKVGIDLAPWGKVLIAGPHASQVVGALLQDSSPPRGENTFLRKEVAGHAILCIQRSLTGETDYLLMIPPDGLLAVWDKLWDTAAPLQATPIGQVALEIARIEQGRPQYGVDMDEETLPIEAGLEAAISYDKGCYPGQEVMARIRTYGHVNKHLVGLKIEGEGLPHGKDKIFVDDREVGWITCATQSPHLKQGIAIGYLRREAATPGKHVEVKSEGGAKRAIVTPLPFYQSERP